MFFSALIFASATQTASAQASSFTERSTPGMCLLGNANMLCGPNGPGKDRPICDGTTTIWKSYPALSDAEAACASEPMCTGLSRNNQGATANAGYYIHGPLIMDQADADQFNHHWNHRCFYNDAATGGVSFTRRASAGMCLAGNANMLCGPSGPGKDLPVCKGSDTIWTTYATLSLAESACAAEPMCTGLSRNNANNTPDAGYYIHGPAEMNQADSSNFNTHWNHRCFYKNGSTGPSSAPRGGAATETGECRFQAEVGGGCLQMTLKSLGRLTADQIALEEDFSGTFDDCVAYGQSVNKPANQGSSAVKFGDGKCTTWVTRNCAGTGMTAPAVCPTVEVPDAPEECVFTSDTGCPQMTLKSLGRLSAAQIATEEDFTGDFEDCVAYGQSVNIPANQGSAMVKFSTEWDNVASDFVSKCETWVTRNCDGTGMTQPAVCPNVEVPRPERCNFALETGGGCPQMTLKSIGRLTPEQAAREADFNGSFEDCVAYGKSVNEPANQGSAGVKYSSEWDNARGRFAATCETWITRNCAGTGITVPPLCPIDEETRGGGIGGNGADAQCFETSFIEQCVQDFVIAGGCDIDAAETEQDANDVFGQVDADCFECENIGSIARQTCEDAEQTTSQTPEELSLDLLRHMIEEAEKLHLMERPATKGSLKRVSRGVTSLIRQLIAFKRELQQARKSL